MNTKFSSALLKRKQEGFIPIIPDIKRISPKEGELFKGRDPVNVVKLLIAVGAPVLSVVTEKKYFGGSMELLGRITETFRNIPVLRKDFITHIKELKTTKDYGASAILLICAIQPFSMIKKLYKEALKTGLEPLVEVHTKEELVSALEMGAKLIGINNRNITKHEKDEGTISTTKILSRYIPDDVVFISESAIKTPEDAKEAFIAGADAVLVGTALWQAENMCEFYNSLSNGMGQNSMII